VLTTNRQPSSTKLFVGSIRPDVVEDDHIS
jgi:hypothetical protein